MKKKIQNPKKNYSISVRVCELPKNNDFKRAQNSLGTKREIVSFSRDLNRIISFSAFGQTER